MDNLYITFEKNFLQNILDTNDILDTKNFNTNNKNQIEFIKEQKISKVFYEMIFKNKKSKNKLFTVLLSNMINLIFNGNKPFQLELETDINKILNIMKNNVNENFFDEILKGKLDEFKQIYKDSNNYIDKLIKKIKISIIKVFHLLSTRFTCTFVTSS